MWAKKIRKSLVYFGSWRQDPTGETALKKFNREWPYLKDGRTPPPDNVSEDGCTLRELVNSFLDSKEAKQISGELSPRTFRDYFKSCEALIDHFGPDRRVDDLRPDDFRDYRSKLAKRVSVTTLKNEINRVCILFNYAHENELIEKPVRFGQEFSRPSAKQLRRVKNQRGPKLFNREEITRLIQAADVHFRAMIYLGLNGGLGNTDIANLPQAAVDLKHGWINFPRPKTEIPRRIPLWPETVQALRESLAKRPAPAEREYADLFFLTSHGVPWVRVKPNVDEDGETKPGTAIDSIALQFGKLLRAVDIKPSGETKKGKQPKIPANVKGLGFYTLRHCLETIGGESRDQVAVDALMGHVDPSMAGNYRQAISDDRLRAVVNVVRDWLFAVDETADGGEGGAE